MQDLENLDWLFEAEIDDFRELIDLKVVINDKMHICCRINKINEKEYNHRGERLERHECQQNYGGDPT